MTLTVRALLKSIAGLFVAFVGGGRPSFALEQRETLTLPDFIQRLRSDAMLRAIFVESPRTILLEYGIDPAPYNLPEKMTSVQLDQLLAQASQAPPLTPPPLPQPQPPAQQGQSAPVYGPPPGFRVPPPPAEAQPAPPVAVYGPPPGLRK